MPTLGDVVGFIDGLVAAQREGVAGVGAGVAGADAGAGVAGVDADAPRATGSPAPTDSVAEPAPQPP